MTCSPSVQSGGFVHLHVHSHYSFFDSTLAPEQIVGLARETACPAVALTDTNSLSGAVLFYKAAMEAGIRPIIGVEVTQPYSDERKRLRERPVVESSRTPDDSESDRSRSRDRSRVLDSTTITTTTTDQETFGEEGEDGDDDTCVSASLSPSLCQGDPSRRVVLLARSFAGYSEISRLVTRRALDPDFDLFAELPNMSPEVIALSDCVEVLEALALARRPAGLDYAVLTPSRQRRRKNRAVYERARILSLPLVVTCDVKLATPADAPLHDLLQAMRRLITVYQLRDSDRIDPARHFQPPELIRAFFRLGSAENSDSVPQLRADLAAALANTVRIAEQCDCRLPLGEWKFPRFESREELPAATLCRLVDRGLRGRYGNPPPEDVRRRADYELSVIDRLHFTEYFLLVHRIVAEARSRGFHTLGRGSAANSIVTYALGISNVCPIRHDLYFERFLNPERSAPPDIDIDFSWKERDEILAWCFDFFGPERVALISTIQTLRHRQAVREVAKAHGVSESEVNAFNRLRETGFRVEEPRASGARPGQAGRGGSRVHNLAETEPWRTILAQSERLVGFPRHLSVHCAGIVITPGEVTEFVPLARSAKGYAITQMDMVGVEDLGLIKIDLLGNRSLGVLKDAIRMAEEGFPGSAGVPPASMAPVELVSPASQHPLNPDAFTREAVRMKMAGTRRGTSVALAGVLQAFPGGKSSDSTSNAMESAPVSRRVFDFEHVTNDPPTRALIDAGRTMGCFYIESPGMRALFERLRCRSFGEVVAASSIIRPGVAESGMMQEYIVRHQQHQEQEASPGQLLGQEMSRAGLPGSRSGTRVAVVLDMAYPGAPKKERDLRSPATLLPASEASERLAGGTMPINAHAKARPIATSPERTAPDSLSRRNSPAPPSELMLRILPETHGVMVYQEDVLRVAHRVAGMSLGEADVLRRIMSGKGKCHDEMVRLESRFFDGARDNGILDADALEIWRQMSSFAGYSFCKGHSAAFAALSYQIAYLKAHFPAEFFAALLSNGGGFYGAGAYVEEARRWGMEVLPPCVNASESDYTGRTLELETGEMKPFPARGWVRVGLGAVMGVSAQSRRRILAERERGGPFTSLHDFVERSGAGAEECRALAKAGALDEVEESLRNLPVQALRPALLLDLACLLRQRELGAGGSFVRLEFSLWKSVPAALSASPAPDLPDNLSHAEICRYEAEHLGFMVSGHPLDFVSIPGDVVAAREIRRHAGQRIRMAGLCIAAKLLAAKNTGRLMKMLTLEDRTDTFEAVLFPRVYARFAPRTLSHGPYLAEGKVDMSLGSPTLNVEQIETLRC